MAHISELNKLFVRVPQSDASLGQVVTTSLTNPKKIYFVEAKKTIVNNGVEYGIDPSTAESLTDLIAVVGQEKLGDNGVDASTVVERLAKLEAIKVNTASDPYLNVSDGTGGNAPEIGVKIVDINLNQQGLVDAVNAKSYIDEKVAAATTSVAVTTGLTMEKTEATANSSLYTISPSLKFEYNQGAAGVPATITLKSVDDVSTFGTVNISDIIGNGLLNDTSYNPNTGVLSLYFATSTPDTSRVVDVSLFDLLDINDVAVDQDSQTYLTVALDGTEDEATNSQAVFTIHTLNVSDASSTSTGLVDAWDVKQYIDSQTTDVAVTAAGDTNYIDASQDTTDRKKINVAAKTATITGNAGVVSQETVSDAGVISGTAANAATLTVDETNGSLLDAGDTVTAVTTYVGGAVAIEAKNRELAIEAAIKSLDSEDSSKGTNVTVDVSLVDGKVAKVGVTEDYAEITYVPHADGEPATMTSYTVSTNDEDKLVKASDVANLKSYTDDKIGEAVAGLAVDASGDTYIDASVHDLKKVVVSANVGTVTITTPAGQDTVLSGEEGKLVDASVMAGNVNSFVNTRISEEVGKLDSVINKKDSAEYVSVSTGMVDGMLSDASSAVSVQYGSFESADASLGIAKTQDVINYVDTYDFWENYSA